MKKSYNVEWQKTDTKKYALNYMFQQQVKLICSQDIGQP